MKDGKKIATASAAFLAFAILAVWPGPGLSGTFRGDRALGEYLASECVTCHQKSGKVVGGVPAIIGWPEDQFLAVMHAYQKGERENQIMRTMAGQFKEDELLALAAYFGSLKPQK
jgi:cytochrome c553